MTADPGRAADALNRSFFLDYPVDAARKMETLDAGDVVEAVSRQPVSVLVPVWRRLLPDRGARLLGAMPDDLADRILGELPPPDAVRIFAHLSEDDRQTRLQRLDPAIAEDLKTLLSYPPDTAGRLMDPRVPTFHRTASVGETLDRVRADGMRTVLTLFLFDDAHRVTGRALLQAVALSDPDTPLSALEKPLAASVRPVDSLEEISLAFESRRVLDLAVVDLDGIFLGAITHDDLVQSIQEDATVDIQTMVGASREERALSSPLFTVRKRMPWLQINLLTAFLAAAVVGIFESTIAQVTALAVLLPVVAGQSGNAGAQALAVTMRGLALREITTRQWSRVMRKEVIAGFLNGLAIAVTCGIGVFIWSQSIGLVAVIASSMILAMVAAGFAGAVIPILLTRLGQDPATSSSIVLTTVTDVAGFFSFLGIATLLMQFL